LTYPPYINLIFDIVIAHNGDEPLKDCITKCLKLLSKHNNGV